MGTPGTQEKRQPYLGLYASDTWKMKPRFTLSYGLRWEPFFPLINDDGSSIHFDSNAARKGVRTTRFSNAPSGVFFDGDSGFPHLTGLNKQWANFSPRLGLAWDVKGDGRTSLRASAGSFYDYPPIYYQIGLANSPPWNPRITRNNVSLDNPWAQEPGGDPFPIPYGKYVESNVPWPAYALVTAADYDTPNMTVLQWNLSLQKQIGMDWLVSATYLGNETTHLWNMQHINPAVLPASGGRH
jgi:hypothetical protein